MPRCGLRMWGGTTSSSTGACRQTPATRSWWCMRTCRPPSRPVWRSRAPGRRRAIAGRRARLLGRGRARRIVSCLSMPPASTITLDGRSLSLADVVAVSRLEAPVAIAPATRERVLRSRAGIESALARGETIYGVNTGFGKLAHVRIAPERLRELQLNLIRSHASGVGAPLPVAAVRAMMPVRANVLLMETSGVRPILAEALVAMLNAKLHPVVPSQGSVGASGDLAPLSHLALAMIGEGPDGARLRTAGLTPVAFEAKEGIAF